MSTDRLTTDNRTVEEIRRLRPSDYVVLIVSCLIPAAFIFLPHPAGQINPAAKIILGAFEIAMIGATLYGLVQFIGRIHTRLKKRKP